MKAKVIEVRKNGEPIEVCVRLERDEDGKDFVKISAWHEDDARQQIYQENQIDFGDARNNFLMCERFINDFSENSAKEFVESFE